MIFEKPDKKQVIRFNALLNRLNLTDMKRDLIAEATGGRTEHTLEMSRRELQQLIDHLATFQKNTGFADGNKKRRRIISLAYQMPPEMCLTRWDEEKGQRAIDMEALDAFLCGKHSIYKKRLNEHTPQELSKVIVQFENMLKSYLQPHSN
jgi:hypothetical protein